MPVTIHAVDLEGARTAFNKKTLTQLIEELPGGRVAAVCAGRELDLFRPAAESRKHRRTLFSAIVEDQAKGTAWDVPPDALDTTTTLLELPGLDEDSGTAYPSLDEPNDRADKDAGELLLLCDAAEEAGAAVEKLTTARVAAGKLPDHDLIYDLLDTLGPLLTAARDGGVVLVAHRPKPQ